MTKVIEVIVEKEYYYISTCTYQCFVPILIEIDVPNKKLHVTDDRGTPDKTLSKNFVTLFAQMS